MEQDQAPLVGTAAEHVGYLDEVDLIGASGIRDEPPATPVTLQRVDGWPVIPENPLADRLTVVLLTFNCAHRLPPILDQLLDLGVPVIAVDNASTDDTVAVINARPGIELVTLERNIGAAGQEYRPEPGPHPVRGVL